VSMSPDALMQMDVTDEHLTGAPPEGHGESAGVVALNKSNMGVEAYHASLHKNGGPAHSHRAAAMSTTDLYRAMPGDFELRKEGSGLPTMYGHFTPIGQWARISSEREGVFMERSMPGAFDESLTHQRPKVLFNHGKDPSIGNKVLGTPRMVNGDASFEVPLYDTSYNRDLIPGLADGEYGVSYRFAVVDQEVVRKPKPSD